MSKKRGNLSCVVSFQEAVFENEGEIPIIRNVVLLGAESKNRRRYKENAMKEAVPLYEKVQAFVNHPTDAEIRQGERDAFRLAGMFKSPRFSEGKIYGDFHGLPNDPASAKFVAIARMPEIAGMSHNAQGKMHKEGNIEIVESIERVFSVDLVTSPATTRGLFEHDEFEEGEEEMLDYKEVTMVGLKESRQDLVTTLVQEGKTSRDAEVKGLQEKVDALEKDKKALEAKIDEYETKNKLSVKEALVVKMLDESKLPTEAKSDKFKSLLMSIDAKEGEKIEELIQEQIDDRIKAIYGDKFVVNNPGRNQKDVTEVSESEARQIAKGFTVGRY